ncbi:J domain-containing protein [Candidatus Woesearchaeota archaeon]|nr:MAG: J domain-containing protein [Candidatus Woesearchaeota archaeon]
MDEDYFEILNLNKSATIADVKIAYRKMAKRYHPDHNPHPEAREIFRLIDKAYKTLSDPVKREIYERKVSEALTDKPRDYLKQYWKNLVNKGMVK